MKTKIYPNFLTFSKQKFILSLTILFIFISIRNSLAQNFYIDPQNGNINNDGSYDKPWSTLKDVFEQNKIETQKLASYPYVPETSLIPKNIGAPVKSGDTLVLRNGFHGTIYACEYYNKDYITITAQNGHSPTLGTIELRSGCKWILKNLRVSPSYESVYVKNRLINFSSHGWTGPSYDCIVENCIAFSVSDADSWTIEDWNNLSCHGINLPGENMIARNNYLKNVDIGIDVTGKSCLVDGNIIEN
ncbi:MAG: hypothetical protein HQK76_06215, partial [Desulfobacterales bacterium]|nr:hypothetical protein [Desulfobacterales bacterium]